MRKMYLGRAPKKIRDIMQVIPAALKSPASMTNICESSCFSMLKSGLGGSRTRDPRIKSPLLCRLSYQP